MAARFNKQSQGTKTVNLAGGEAYTQSPELALISILLTSFANDQYYRKADDAFADLKALISANDKQFVAKAVVYARTKFGMRSITHVAASELAKAISGEKWAKDFYNAIVYRPDDMSEILSYHLQVNGKITNAMKKGFAKAFERFDAYQLGKYRGEQKAIKLVDVVNLIHPVPVDKNAQAIKALVAGDLKSFNTWESELTKAGQQAETEEQKDELKKEVWVKLIRERKIGYFALLRNLRNIIEQAPELIDEACALLIDEKLIRKSLVLPFRYLTALEQFQNRNDATKIIVALNQAVDIACANVPKFDGRSLVVCDYSGSMGDGYQSNKFKGSLFGAIFAKANASDFMIFGDDASYVSYNPGDSVLTITKGFTKHNTDVYHNFRDQRNKPGIINVGHGTNFHAIFQRANRAYDRIIIFSDMQGWIGYATPENDFRAWKQKTSSNPVVYSFDLAGYGNMQFPEVNVYCLAGLSEKVYDIMKLMELDKQALISEIKRLEFTKPVQAEAETEKPV